MTAVLSAATIASISSTAASGGNDENRYRLAVRYDALLVGDLHRQCLLAPILYLETARHSRKLQAGAQPTISTTSRKPTKIAMEEIRAGEIAVDLDPQPQEPVEFEELDEALEEAQE